MNTIKVFFRFHFLMLLLWSLPILLFSQTYQTVSNGSWSSSSTWSGGSVPSVYLGGKNVTISHRVTWNMGNDLYLQSGTLNISGKLIIPDHNIKMESSGGVINLECGLIIIYDDNFENKNATVNFNCCGGIQLGNGNYKNENSARTNGYGYIYSRNGNIENSGGSFSSGISWCIGNGNGVNLPTSENCGSANPPRGYRDETFINTRCVCLNANAGADKATCRGQSVALTASGGGSYMWSTGQTTQSINVSPSSNTTYTVTVSNSYGCSDEDQVRVTVYSDPNAYAGSDRTICRGQSTTLTASGGGSYRWNTEQTSRSITVSPTSTKTYTVTVTNNNGCTDQDQVRVTVAADPNANAGSDQEICAGESANLSASASGGTSPYTYEWNNGLGNGANKTVSPEGTTIYTVLVTDANGCTDEDQVTVTVNSLPSYTILDKVCSDFFSNYRVELITNADVVTSSHGTVVNNGGGSWTIEDINNDQDIIVTFTLNGTNCSATASIEAPNCLCPPIDPPVSGGDKEICANETIPALTATVGLLTLVDWYDAPTGGNLLLANSTSYTPSAAGIYYAEARLEFFEGCVSDARTAIELIINPLPDANAGDDEIVCNGDPVTLTATGGTQYLWSTSATTASITVSPSSNATYTVTVTDANGCFDSDEVNVTVQSRFTSGIDGPDTRCAGEGLLFAATPPVNDAIYNWTFSGPATPASSTDPSVVVTWASEGTYTATLTVTKGACVEVYTHEVEITQEVFAAAGPDQEICQGASVQIGGNPTGPSGADYLWTPTLFLNNNTSSNPVATPPETFIYTVQVTQNGCTRTESVTVNVDVDLNPKPEAGAAQSTCDNVSVTIGDPNAIPNVDYQWSTAAGDISGATASTLEVNPSSSTWYFVTAINDQGCSGVDSVLVSVWPSPTANAGNNDAICDGESTTLSASATGGTAPYTFSWNNGLGTGASQSVSPSTTTTYVVTVTDANLCSSTDTVVIVVHLVPTVDAGPNQSTCGVEQVTLSASGSGGTPPYTYEWNNGLGSGATHTVSPEVPTVYTVLLTDANGCTATDEVRITVNEIPVVDLGADMTTCEGDERELTATVNGGLSPYSYAWSTGATTESISVAPVTTTTYSVTVTDQNGCSSSDGITINVDSGFVSGISGPSTRCAGEQVLFTVNPTVSGATYSWFFSGPSTPSTSTAPSVLVTWGSEGVYLATLTVTRGACVENYDKPINITQEVFAAAGEDKEICEGQSVTIGGSPTGPPGADYLWTPNFFINNNTVANPAVTPPETTRYTVQVTQNGCITTESVTVTVNAELNPQPEAGPDTAVCLGETVTIGGPADPNAFFMQWSTSAGDISGTNSSYLDVSPTVDTWYFITAYNQLGCIGVDSVLVTVNPNPVVNIGDDQAICSGDEATFTATVNGGTAPFSYEWSTGATTESITVSPASTTTYSVTVTDANGCIASDEAVLTIHPNPVADAGEDQENCGVEESTLTATATGGTALYTF